MLLLFLWLIIQADLPFNHFRFLALKKNDLLKIYILGCNIISNLNEKGKSVWIETIFLDKMKHSWGEALMENTGDFLLGSPSVVLFLFNLIGVKIINGKWWVGKGR